MAVGEDGEEFINVHCLFRSQAAKAAKTVKYGSNVDGELKHVVKLFIGFAVGRKHFR